MVQTITADHYEAMPCCKACVPMVSVVAGVCAVTPAGGHLGWVSPSDPRGAPSVHESVVDFFSAVLEHTPAKTAASDAQQDALQPEPQPVLVDR